MNDDAVQAADVPRRLAQALKPADLADPVRWQALVALAQDMEAQGVSKDAPCREMLRLLGDRWSALVVSVLATGAYRHGELLRVVNALSRVFGETLISQRMLTLRLQAMERDGLVVRSIVAGRTVSVTYRLTAMGRGFGEQLEAMMDWSAAFGEMIQAAQRRFDAWAIPRRGRD